jgi:5-methylthioadenosine/S-adenosylhomocysteine deaminase
MAVHIHLHETKTEVENSIAKYGCNPLEICRKSGLLDGATTAAHCVWMDGEDIAKMKEYGVVPVHNPSSNMYLGSGFAPLPAMLKAELKPALGTDGAASNNNLDMFNEMRMAALIHKGTGLDASAVDAKSVIGMATSSGAAAIGFPESGVLKAGAAADIILIDSDKPKNSPMINPVNAVVYSTGGADVDTVIVDGKILMEKGELLTLDEERAKYDARKASSRLLGG